MIMKRQCTLFVLACLVVSMLFSSCSVNRKTVYFNDLPETARFNYPSAEFTEPVIMADDILSIQIQTIDPAATAQLNQGAEMQLFGASSASNVGSQQVSGFLVDKSGHVTIPMFGAIEVAGLTTQQAKDRVTAKVATLYRDPTVQVRFANYKITVLGEVARPASYTMPNEKVTVLDALGLAGDMTIFGRRDNVLLVRDAGGEKEFIRLDLNSAEIFNSPYFYLKQNDVIYVEPGKGRSLSADAPRLQLASVIASFLSIAVLLITRL